MRLSQIHRFLPVIAVLGGTGSFALGQQDTLIWPPAGNPVVPLAGYDQDYLPQLRNVATLYYEATAEIPTTKDKLLQIGPLRPVVVITPPNYTKTKSYPVLYLLHGFGGNQNSWTSEGNALNIYNNLVANGKIVPMIVVMPDNHASTVAENLKDMPAVHAAYRLFEKELIEDLIPFIDSKYSTIRSADGRALAGLSEGAEQAVKFGLENLDTFSYIGAFSPGGDLMANDLSAGVALSAKNFVPPDPIPNIENLRLFWLSCGYKAKDKKHWDACRTLVAGLNGSNSFINALNAPLLYSVRPISWGHGLGVPSTGKNLILVGTDYIDRLHIRIFDGRGKLVSDWEETQPASPGLEVMILKEQLLTFGPDLTDDQQIQIITEVSSIVDDSIPVLNKDLRHYDAGHDWSVWKPSLYYFLQDISWDQPIY
jgi:hypothetical protein